MKKFIQECLCPDCMKMQRIKKLKYHFKCLGCKSIFMEDTPLVEDFIY